jgi:hypothetical protein
MKHGFLKRLSADCADFRRFKKSNEQKVTKATKKFSGPATPNINLRESALSVDSLFCLFGEREFHACPSSDVDVASVDRSAVDLAGWYSG